VSRNPAEAYENYIVPALFEPFASDLVKRVDLRQDARVLDVACGTGIVARCAARAVGDTSTRGADPNPAMLEVARSAAQREDLAIEWHQAPAEDLPLPDASVDVVLCQQGAQFFQDRDTAAREMLRVLDDGGRIAVSTWQSIERHPFFGALHDAMQRHVGSGAAAAPFGLSDPAELCGMFEGAGFQKVEADTHSRDAVYPDPHRFLSETIDALAAVVTAMQDIDPQEFETGIETVKSEMQEPLQEVTRGDNVVLPWHTNIVTATR
jgi:ubiquinone/menaquinone biosynthesis C-methylase UbiE